MNETRPTPVASAAPWSRLIHLLWQQALWAIPFALFFGTLYGARWETYLQAYRYSVVFAYSIGLAIWATRFFVVPRLPHPPGLEPSALSFALAYGSIALASSYLAALTIHLTFGRGFLGEPRSVLIVGMYAVLFIGLFSGIRFAMAYHRMALLRARAVEQMRAELAQAELRALRAQIHPHFLFNTLNSIASLIASNPRAAEEVTTQLADLFRYTLQASDRETSALSEELDFLRAYLAIEHVRFGERLRVQEDVRPGLESIPVPSLLLQPLVENAVRYAVAPRTEGGTIRIGARRDGDRLVLEVTDDGPGLDGHEAPSGTGFGLHAVRERLRAAGHADALDIDSAPGLGTRARITLPLVESSPQEP